MPGLNFLSAASYLGPIMPTRPAKVKALFLDVLSTSRIARISNFSATDQGITIIALTHSNIFGI